MISENTKTIINNYIDEYLDEMLRDEFIFLDRNRKIDEVSPGKYNVQDTDLVIDESRNYSVILKHPIEKYLIPEKVDLVVVEFVVELELPDLVNLINFDTSGIIQSQEIPIGDSRISDDQLKVLLNYTCFDSDYQNIYPEVKPYLIDVYKSKHSDDVRKFLDRALPFLGI